MPPKKLKYERAAGRGGQKKESKFFAGFLAVCLLIVTIAALSVAYFSLGKEISPLVQSVLSRGWTKTEGKIIRTFTSTKSVPCGGRSSRGCVEYAPNVVYLYRVGDTEYQGERINFSAVNTFDSAEASDDYLNYYQNKTVEVFYNPNNFQESTLSQEYVYKFNDYYAGCCCGSVGIFFGTLFWFSAKDLVKLFRNKKTSNDKQ
jgi:hypothetical protein